MGMIDRYKKKGGFVQLLNLIETTGSPKQEKFLKLIADESPRWESEVRKKMLSVERIASWPTNFLMEFLPKIPPLAIGLAIHALKPEHKNAFLAALSHSEKRKVDDAMLGKNPNPGEISASQIRMINEVRSLVANGQLKFEHFDADMVIPENIEELLNSGPAPVSDKEVAQHFDQIPQGVPSSLAEELNQLRKKVVQLIQENNRLTVTNTELKEKIEAIKKIA